MKKTKNLILAACALFFCGFSFAQVSVNPVYTSERFKPSDKFHAGCENQIDVVFQLDNSKINWVNAILQYDWNDVEILKVLAVWEKENNLSYTVEKDKIVFSKLKTDWAWLDKVTFSLFFKVETDLEKTDFSFSKWSYVVDSKWNMVELTWNYSFEFTEVPECDPDIVAPSVDLVFPSSKTGEYVALDTYFQFDIDDQGKWVNVDSIKFTIGGLEYSINGLEHEWRGNLLTIYPDVWMPFNTWFSVQIAVSDKQSYGKPNTTTKTYKFQTSDELKFLNEINPVDFRKIVNMNKYLRWTSDECGLLSEVYSEYYEKYWEELESINTKLWCEELVVMEKTWDEAVIQEIDNDNSKISVFAMFGWILCGSLFFAMVFGRLGKK